MIDYSNPRANEYLNKFEKLKQDFNQQLNTTDEDISHGKGNSNFDVRTKALHVKIKQLQQEYKDIFYKQ